MKDINKKASKINNVSKSFCLAKWTQVTIDLENGKNHSCHHPKRHNIPLDELEKNNSALHNTTYKKLQRLKMLKGHRPAECSFCWNVEDLQIDQHSDRIIKSTNDWSYERLEEIKNSQWNDNVSPSYLEIMFSSNCNLSCTYCIPEVSTKLRSELRKFGDYNLIEKDRSIESYEKYCDKSHNTYLEKFWDWFPEVSNQLKFLRITGGEPTLDPNFWLLLKKLKASPQPELTLAINTNLLMPDSKFQLMISEFKNLIELKSIKNIELYASCDSVGIQAEYIRTGMNFELFDENLNHYLTELKDQRTILMVTFSILSLQKIDSFFDWIESVKKKHSNFKVDFSQLTSPSFFHAQMAPSELKKKFKKAFFEKVNPNIYYDEFEKEKIFRLAQWLEAPNEEINIKSFYLDFYNFNSEYSRRYGYKFKDVFPDLGKVYMKAHLFKNVEW